MASRQWNHIVIRFPKQEDDYVNGRQARRHENKFNFMINKMKWNLCDRLKYLNVFETNKNNFDLIKCEKNAEKNVCSKIEMRAPQNVDDEDEKSI